MNCVFIRAFCFINFELKKIQLHKYPLYPFGVHGFSNLNQQLRVQLVADSKAIKSLKASPLIMMIYGIY